MLSFHTFIRPVLLIFLLFGQFPLHGILRYDPTRWQFRWCSFQTLFCLLLVHAGLLLCYIEYDRLHEIGVNADNLIGPLFYIDVVYVNTALTMVWTVQDVVIIMISAAIARYFKCINGRVQFYTTVQVLERSKFWTEILTDYTTVCQLLEEMFGAVITYELVMLHFARTTANQGIVPKCSQLEFSFEPKDERSA
ncbi:hypothetical protein AND_008844 [Anopheles darlingi]|uniref:Gustatory receptor n=1 Tax=Anopheles darlingi TaxID=43151 RepID=W5J521_ANODA|nr:hypothetical protein AND_008844 [Anopheles darlingi]